MSTAETNQNEMQAGDPQSTECCLYLLGELDAEATKRFEKKLAGNPELSELLLQQAGLITAVAQSQAFNVSHPQPTVCEDANVDAPQQWRWIAALVSVAACIALVFSFQRFGSPHASTASTGDTAAIESAAMLEENVLIAKAWASSHPTSSFETADSGTGESEVVDLAEPESYASLELALDDRPNDIDATVSWMFAAISSGSDAGSEEGNDG